MHDTTTKNDLLRTQCKYDIGHCFGKILAFQLPYYLIIYQFICLLAPSCLNRGTRSQSFQTAVMAGAYALTRIMWILCNQNMSCFWMHHTMQKPATYCNTCTYSCSYGKIRNGIQSFGTAIGHFTQTGTIYICIQSYRNM